MAHYILLLLLFCFHNIQAQQLFINEVCASNDSVLVDSNANYSDWIELYNASSQSLNLGGYFLSDNTNEPEKWKFPPNVSIPPQGYLMVWASAENTLIGGVQVHTNFEIDAVKESIVLSAPDTSLLDQLTLALAPTDKSYGRQPDGASTWYFFDLPSPATTNNNQTATLLSPVFSDSAGFFTDTFSLGISGLNLLDTILYTLDGSVPDINNLGGKYYTIKQDYTTSDTLSIPFQTFLYTQSIHIKNRSSDTNKLAMIRPSPAWWTAPPTIFKGTVVKACTYKSGYQNSPIVTHSYFVDPLGDSKYSLPVFSISINEDKFFDYHHGIHVPGNIYYDNPPGTYWPLAPANYGQLGRIWEQEGHLEYFVQGEKKIGQNIGIRTTGHKSRAWGRKSFRVYARSSYDDFQNKLRYPIFEGLRDKTFYRNEVDQFKRLVIRNFGTYWKKHIYVDAFQQDAVRHLDLDILSSSASIVFVNGEYWGVMNARERPDRYYFESHYDIDQQDVVIHERHDGTVTTGFSTDSVHYMKMRNFICNNDMSIQSNFDSAATYMDTENFAKLFMAHIYVNNTDWTIVDRKCWRKRTNSYLPQAAYGHDGRFRWIFYDLDHGYVDEIDDKIDEYMTDNSASTCMFRSLMTHDGFKKYWINLMADHMNTTFLPSRIQNMIDSLAQLYAPEMPDHLQRWQGYYSTAAIQTFNWSRTHYMREHILSYFNEVSDTLDLIVDVNAIDKGIVKVNSIGIESTTPGVDSFVYPWKGSYFKGVPVTLIAQPKDGYKFIEWLGTGITTDTLLADMNGDSSFTAVFGSIDTVNNIIINEVLSKNSNVITDNYGEYDDYFELYNRGNDTTNISKLYLTDNPLNKGKWKISNDIPVLDPGGFVLFWADEDQSQGPNHTNFKLSGNETLYLYQIIGTDTVAMDQMTMASSVYENVSKGRYPNGDANIQFFDFPTPDASNDLPDSFDDIFINEFMCENSNTIADQAGEYDDWIELYNAGALPVNVAGLYLTDDFTSVDKYRIPFSSPDSTTIQAGGFLMLWADNDTEQGLLHLSFKLNNSSEEIALNRYSVLNSSTIDTISYTFASNSGSYGRQSDGAATWTTMNPTPEASNNITISPTIEASDCYVYPNPTRRYIYIEGNAVEEIQLFNINGVQQLSMLPTSEITRLDLSSFDGQLYVLCIKTASKYHYAKIIVMPY